MICCAFESYVLKCCRKFDSTFFDFSIQKLNCLTFLNCCYSLSESCVFCFTNLSSSLCNIPYAIVLNSYITISYIACRISVEVTTLDVDLSIASSVSIAVITTLESTAGNINDRIACTSIILLIALSNQY